FLNQVVGCHSMLSFLILLLPSVHSSISCFSCASSDYSSLLGDSSGLGSVSIRTFASSCEGDHLSQSHPSDSCDSTCLTIFEPFYFGGIQVDTRPFTVIRGCTHKILNYVDRLNRPREIDFLHEGSICVDLTLASIFPQVTEDLTVRACSCVEDECNKSSRPSISSSSFSFFFPSLFLLHSLLLLL
ncbi:hypothetical protein PMAYCL1PPCAC_24014, partial [Pristionchus mayeri]